MRQSGTFDLLTTPSFRLPVSVWFDLALAFGPAGLADCLNAPLVSDLGIMDEGRRYGVRTR